MTGAEVPAKPSSPGEIRAAPGRWKPTFLLGLSVPFMFGLYLLLTSTTALIADIWPYDAKRILQFALLLFLFSLPLVNSQIRDDFGRQVQTVPRWLKLTLTAIAAWGVLSALVNAHSLMHALNSLSEVALLSTLVLSVFIVAACRSISGRWFDRITIGMLALTGLTVGVQELIAVMAVHSAGVDFNFRVSLMHFSWPRFYNQVQTWMVPTLVAIPVLFKKNRLASNLCILVLALQWYIILMTAGRGSFVSIVAAVSLALIFLPDIRALIFKWQAAGFIAGVLIFAAVLFSFDYGMSTTDPVPAATRQQDSRQDSAGQVSLKAISPGTENSFFEQSVGKPMMNTSFRLGWWKQTLEDTRKHPLLGIGPMNYVCTSPARIGHPHNFPLQLAAEWGLPAAIAACLVFIFIVWKAATELRMRHTSEPDDYLIGGLLLTGVLAAAFHACLSGIMVMPASQATGVLICGTLYGLFPKKQEPASHGGARWVFIAGLIMVLALGGLGAHELQTMTVRSKALRAGDSMWPRIWQDAKVCQLYVVQNEVNN